MFIALEGSRFYFLFKSSEHINEKGDEPYRGFDNKSLVSDPLDLATCNQRELLRNFATFTRV